MTNYAAWEKFDVERAIEEVGQNHEILGSAYALLLYRSFIIIIIIIIIDTTILITII
jgi:hypothetical protein